LKPIAPNIDKESVSWTLSWQPDGRCGIFTREAILTNAPPTSGVYGLFNFDCQVFIGESANIQQALLRHESETDFQSQHLQPTGFTFEPCAAELRKTKADELIARFRPVLQTGAALIETWSRSNGQILSETDQVGQELETYADHQEFPVYERAERPKARRRFQLKRPQAVTLAAMFVASAVVIFYLGMPDDYAIQKRASGANPTSDQTEIGLRPQNASSPNGALRVAAKSASANDKVGVQTPLAPGKIRPMAGATGSANLSKEWSVQISAAAAKDIADTLIQQLKAKGYDGYMVQAEVKGQTYYRVRVGHFDTRERAESVRQSLVRQEGYRDAYLTGD
jgi:cell division septation protein DedD